MKICTCDICGNDINKSGDCLSTDKFDICLGCVKEYLKQAKQFHNEDICDDIIEDPDIVRGDEPSYKAIKEILIEIFLDYKVSFGIFLGCFIILTIFAILGF